MSKAKVKKTLMSLDRDEIVAMIMEMYSARKEAKEYLEYWVEPDDEKELEKCRKLVRREFFTPQGVSRRGPSLKVLSKIAKDFMSICFDPELVGDLLLYIPEQMAEWMAYRYKKVAYRTSMRKYLDEAKLYVETHELEPVFGIRLERLTQETEAILQWQENDYSRWRRYRR